VNYIDEIASSIRSRVDHRSLPEGDLQQLFAIYALVALTCGPTVSGEDVHNAWAAWMTFQDDDHPALIPYAELDPSTASDDTPFVAAIREVAIERGIVPSGPRP